MVDVNNIEEHHKKDLLSSQGNKLVGWTADFHYIYYLSYKWSCENNGNFLIFWKEGTPKGSVTQSDMLLDSDQEDDNDKYKWFWLTWYLSHYL